MARESGGSVSGRRYLISAAAPRVQDFSHQLRRVPRMGSRCCPAHHGTREAGMRQHRQIQSFNHQESNFSFFLELKIGLGGGTAPKIWVLCKAGWCWGMRG